MKDVDTEIQQILERNKRVEQDKTWETSWTLRIFVTLLTFFCAYLFLKIIKVENALLAAVVPAGGYWFSKMTLPPLRKIWEKLKKS